MSFEKGPLDRLLGSGRLVVESAGEHGQIVLRDIPRVESTQATLSRLVEEEQRGWSGTRGTSREPDHHLAPADGIAEITLTRPEAMNAISTAMAAELTRVFAELAAASEVRVVVFGAAGTRAFSAGADLKDGPA